MITKQFEFEERKNATLPLMTTRTKEYRKEVIRYKIKFFSGTCAFQPHKTSFCGDPNEKNTADVRKCTRSGRAGASAQTSKPIENRVFSSERVSAFDDDENERV